MNGQAYDRSGARENGTFSFIGKGELGGKADGLVSIQGSLTSSFPDNRFGPYIVDIPNITVLRTGIFSDFIRTNNLEELMDGRHADGYIADRFQHADFSPLFTGDIMSLVSESSCPLAVRSSSLLEDTLSSPFAGVYMTKMIPNNQLNSTARFRKLLEAVKLVYASTFFWAARTYADAAGIDSSEEKMAVLIQQVAGSFHGDRYYPAVSGVARSINFYPSGNAKSEDGIVQLALGLGKTIVDGGASWYYSPRYPASPPPFRSAGDSLKVTQSEFWALRLDNQETYNPVEEVEFLDRHTLDRAEADGVLQNICSTYDSQADRFEPGARGGGARLVDFYSLRKGSDGEVFNDLVLRVLKSAEDHTGKPVEIEFALDRLPSAGKDARFSLLQVRPMALPDTYRSIEETIPANSSFLVRSDKVVGNGRIEDLRDFVYVRPDRFKPGDTLGLAREVEEMNRTIQERGGHYILIGFGRWGSSDPWLGIPVQWPWISAARVIVESEFPGLYPDFSQGAHFFHNLCNLGVLYMYAGSKDSIDWLRLEKMDTIYETDHLRHVRSPEKVLAWADYKKGTGGILQ